MQKRARGRGAAVRLNVRRENPARALERLGLLAVQGRSTPGSGSGGRPDPSVQLREAKPPPKPGAVVVSARWMAS